MSSLSSSSTGGAHATIDILERYFSYHPNPYGSGFFATLFGLIILIIVIQTLLYYTNRPSHHPNPNNEQQIQSSVSSWTYHGYKLLWIVGFTAICLLIGLAIRINMVESDKPTLMAYVIHQAFLIISPNALAYVNYSLLGLVISTSEYINPNLLTTQPFYLKGRNVSRLFLLSDFIAFFIQSSSTPLLTNKDPKMADLGSNIMIAGLIIQLLFFTMFTWITRYVHTQQEYTQTRPNIMNQFFTVLYFTIICLYVRSIYRIIEFAQSSHHLPEAYFFIFDMSFLSLCMFAYVGWRNPANILRVAQTQEELQPSVGMTSHGKEHLVP